MKLSVCTISFRHELVSLSEIARWASSCQFQGIELWGVHAMNLEHSMAWAQEQIHGQHLECSMISDYFNLEAPKSIVLERAERIFQAARSLGTNKVRTFAGTQGSAGTTEAQWQQAGKRLNALSKLAADHACALLVETHPNTLADSYESTCRLLEMVDQPAFGLNFDVLHVWESGMDPTKALQAWDHKVQHFHLKNVRSRAHLNDFLPGNVYAASGSREGMVPLFQGAFDYHTFFEQNADRLRSASASLEWFGPQARQVLATDRAQVVATLRDQDARTAAG